MAFIVKYPEVQIHPTAAVAKAAATGDNAVCKQAFGFDKDTQVLMAFGTVGGTVGVPAHMYNGQIWHQPLRS